MAIVLPWEGAVDGIAEALATCVQKTFNYLLGLKPLTGRKPVHHRYKNPIPHIRWSIQADVCLNQCSTDMDGNEIQLMKSRSAAGKRGLEPPKSENY